MKKKFLSLMLVMALLAGVYNVAMAADTEGATRNSLKSSGTIEYREGNNKVVINADDLYMLADRIDQFKLKITEQLEAMHTFFTAGEGIALKTDQPVSVTHTRPSGADAVDPLSIDLGTLMEGIAASQSVSPDVTVYGYSSGTTLYKCPDGSLTTDGSVEGAEQIYVEEASAENLSAGTVAWVKGQPILGTGGDNKSYYDQGKENGASGLGNVGKMKTADLKNGKIGTTTYLVTESVKDAFIFLFAGSASTLSFEDTSGNAVEYQKICDNKMTSRCVGALYYVPELHQNTTITTNASRAYLYTFSGECLNTVHAVTPNSTYLATEDMYDVILMHVVNDGKIKSLDPPEFTTADGSVVAFKKLYNYTGESPHSDETRYDVLYMYYVPVIKAGTLIEGLYTQSAIVY